MSDADFFQKLDKQIGAHKHQEAAKKDHKKQMAIVTRDFIAQVKPTMERYKTELENRGFDVKLSITGMDADYLVFELQYSHGGYHGFEIHDGKIMKTFTDKGKRYRSEGTNSIANGMSLESFEGIVQQTINDFMVHAPAEGGWKKIY